MTYCFHRIYGHSASGDIPINTALNSGNDSGSSFYFNSIFGLLLTHGCSKDECDDLFISHIPFANLLNTTSHVFIYLSITYCYRFFSHDRRKDIFCLIDIPSQSRTHHIDRFGKTHMAQRIKFPFLLELIKMESCSNLLLKRHSSLRGILNSPYFDAFYLLTYTRQNKRQEIH